MNALYLCPPMFSHLNSKAELMHQRYILLIISYALTIFELFTSVLKPNAKNQKAN